MAVPTATSTMIVLVVAMLILAPAQAMSNELDYGYWNYREGTDNVNVANVRSVTRVLDAWGKKIFHEIKTLLHSQPSTLLPDYSRVRPLSESLNDLFKEVSHLQRRITDLNNRLATLQPVLFRHGYSREGEERNEGAASAPQSMRGAGASLARYPRRYRVRVVRPVSQTVRTRRMRVHKDKNGQVLARHSER